MTNEEKLILLKDLCARLPYGVNVRGVFFVYNEKLDKCRYEMCDRELDLKNFSRFQTLKPYLRSMASMTEEEWKEYDWFIKQESDELIRFRNTLIFYNKHHIDYNDLISKGLAIEAPEGMYD